MIRALRGVGIFACDCQVVEGAIRVGMLVLDSTQIKGGDCLLVDVDAEDRAYSIRLPEPLKELTYGATLCLL